MKVFVALKWQLEVPLFPVFIIDKFNSDAKAAAGCRRQGQLNCTTTNFINTQSRGASLAAMYFCHVLTEEYNRQGRSPASLPKF